MGKNGKSTQVYFYLQAFFVQIWAKNESENKQKKIAFPQIFELSEK